MNWCRWENPLGAFSFRRTDFSCGSDARNSIAKDGGVRKGDVIKEINGKEVSCASAQAPRDIFQTGIEGDLIIKVERDGKPVELCNSKKGTVDSSEKAGYFVLGFHGGIGTITYPKSGE